MPAQLIDTIEAAAKLQAFAAQSMSDQARAATLADKSKAATARVAQRRRATSGNSEAGGIGVEDSLHGRQSMASLVDMTHSGLVSQAQAKGSNKRQMNQAQRNRRRLGSGVEEQGPNPGLD